MPYRIARDDKPYSPERLRLDATLAEVQANAKKIGPMHRIKRDGMVWGGAMYQPKFMSRIERVLREAALGDVTVVAHGTDRNKGESRYLIKKVIPKPKPELPLEQPSWWRTYLTDVNVRVSKVAYAAYGYDDEVACLGSQVCKQIAGSSTWSQHAYGNAIDLAFRLPLPVGFDLPRQDDLADYLVTHAEELALEHVIHRNRAWTRGAGWYPYGGIYHTHVHGDCTPQGSGWPPCA